MLKPLLTTEQAQRYYIPAEIQEGGNLMQYLIEFVCPKCGRFLLWTLENADVHCPHCNRWVTKETSGRNCLCRIPADENADIELF